MRSIGYGEGLFPRMLKHNVRGDSPSPGFSLRENPTSPRKRGEISRTRAPLQLNVIAL
jgi:hypothetical protein